MSVFHARRIVAVSGLTIGAALALAGPALAHVTANPNTAVQGSYTKISFRVPNEEASANTTQLEVDMPLDHPVASVSVRPVPGWTIAVTKGKLPKPVTSDDGTTTIGVTKIVWSGGSITPGQFQEFDVSMGPLPTDTDTLQFKALQTYSDGTVVHWDQPTSPGGKEPDHPAPTVHLTKASTTASTTASTAKTAAVTTSASGSTAGDDGTARWLGGVGLAAGVIGIGVGAYGLARARGARS
jgi:uncharacterized protein YcnI